MRKRQTTGHVTRVLLNTAVRDSIAFISPRPVLHNLRILADLLYTGLPSHTCEVFGAVDESWDDYLYGNTGMPLRSVDRRP